MIDNVPYEKRPFGSDAEFHRVVREALETYRERKALDLEEKAEIKKIRDEKAKQRKRITSRYDRRMARVMAHIRSRHPEVLKSGDRAEFETAEMIVRFNRDKNGTLVVPDVESLIKYLERRKDLRHLVKVVKSLSNKVELKQWMRKHPRHRPPAVTTYTDSIILLEKPLEQPRSGKRSTVRPEELFRHDIPHD